MGLTSQVIHDLLNSVGEEASINQHLLVDSDTMVLRSTITDPAGDVTHRVSEVILVNEEILAASGVLTILKVTLTLVLVLCGVVFDVLHVLEVSFACR